MNTAVGLDDIAHFSDLQGKSGVFEWLLHLSSPKDAKIPAFPSRTAVGELFCELAKLLVGPVDLGLISSENLNSFGL